MDINPVSLSELASRVRQTIEKSLPESFWVIAEIAELREHRNGHCYIELIEKDPNSNQITARMRANIWSYAYRLLKPYFETTTRQQLMPGIKILVKGNVEYQEVFGLSLNIKDIEPSFTIGDIEQKRRLIIAKLEDEGVLEMNKELELPEVLQRIAVISSPTAAGFEDFTKQLNGNSAGIKYTIKLFPAIMQGEQTESSVIAALDKIFKHEQLFDAVAIVRGGGAAADLMSFDAYELALNITQFPLPVLTGIGHERDFTVTDLVAHTHLKTPTAVAEFINAHNQTFINWLSEAQMAVADIFSTYTLEQNEKLAKLAMQLQPMVNRHLDKQHIKINRLADKGVHWGNRYIALQKAKVQKSAEKLENLTNKKIERQDIILDFLTINLKKAAQRYLLHHNEKLKTHSTTNALHSPEGLLKRGYSITLINGKAVKSIKQLQLGDSVKTLYADGQSTSTITDITK